MRCSPAPSDRRTAYPPENGAGRTSFSPEPWIGSCPGPASTADLSVRQGRDVLAPGLTGEGAGRGGADPANGVRGAGCLEDDVVVVSGTGQDTAVRAQHCLVDGSGVTADG